MRYPSNNTLHMNKTIQMRCKPMKVLFYNLWHLVWNWTQHQIQTIVKNTRDTPSRCKQPTISKIKPTCAIWILINNRKQLKNKGSWIWLTNIIIKLKKLDTSKWSQIVVISLILKGIGRESLVKLLLKLKWTILRPGRD